MDTNINTFWQKFERLILDPIKASPVQRKEMRRAFYCGAACMFELLVQASDTENEDLAIATVETFNQELDHFSKMIAKGQA